MKRLRPFEALYNVFQATATKRNGPSGISYEEFLEFTNTKECHYCSIAIPWTPYTAGKNNAYFLDRKDNAISYTKANCVVCCSRCNWGKNDKFSYEEWLEIGKTIRAYRERNG